MKTHVFVTVAVLLAFSSITAAQSWKPPTESERCPSKWGAGDERGAANHMNPASVLTAARLIRTGEVIELGHVLRAGMPIQATPGSARRKAGLRVRFRDTAAQDPRRHRLDRGTRRIR
jgi:hypothetical protein